MSKIDEILGKAIVGDGFISFSEQGKQTAQEAKSALYDLILKGIESCPERGFGVPKTGTPDHAKGTFTKLIAEQDVKDKLKELFDGIR